MEGTMQEVFDYLKFTTEIGEEFKDGWLPTLDVSLKVEERSCKVNWKFFEKPTTSKTTVQRRSAMGGQIKSQILSNDLVRRLLNTGEDLPDEERIEVINNYTLKLKRSGHSEEKTREIILGGIRGYERKVRRRKKEGKPLYRTSDESLQPRQMKKLMGSKSWYRKKRKAETEEAGPSVTLGGRGGDSKRRRLGLEDGRSQRRIPTRSVIFVDFTENSALTKEIRETLERLETIVGCKIKAVERGGTPISRLFPLTRLWEGMPCARH